jgi:16S rRNA processing protein RimM
MPEQRILLGVIGRPHGVRGLVRVTSHTADPADLTAYGPLSDDKGRSFLLRWRGKGVAEVEAQLGGAAVKIADRTAAEKLTNTRLYVDRVQLPEPDADEFYLADLIGMAATDAAGRVLGRVATVHDYGAGASLEIVRDSASPVLVPFTHTAVPEVDVARGRVTVLLPDEIEWGAGNTNSTPSSVAEENCGEGPEAHPASPAPGRSSPAAPHKGGGSADCPDSGPAWRVS